MYKRTVTSEDTKEYTRYKQLPAANYDADSVSLDQVTLVYVDGWTGRTVETHAPNLAAYASKAHNWSVSYPFYGLRIGGSSFNRDSALKTRLYYPMYPHGKLGQHRLFIPDTAGTAAAVRYLPGVLNEIFRSYH